MVRSSIHLPFFFLLLTSCIAFVRAVKFELTALKAPGNRRCISQWVPEDTLVVAVVNAADTGSENQQIDVEVSDRSGHSNQYWRKINLIGEQKFAFKTHDDAEVDFCFTNTLSRNANPSPDMKRLITFSVNTGAEAVDMSEEIKNKKIKPVEAEISRLEGLVTEIVDQMAILKEREIAMRDLNESTNSRVKWFNIVAMTLVGISGAYQVLYLKRFFQAKVS
ncbi:emp24/gp25L/p24 family/GOLD-domain-containing protein [Gaertneriomyces semiglobifer]|nr:emp24/gp25L/p24 family/GOLD-domain-containing protein [Gaertneriomyces semiglobifer]